MAFREVETRANARAYLALGRGVGATPADMRHVTGDHVLRRPGSGLWVALPGEDGPEGPWVEVPVLARYASPLEDLADARGALALIRKTVPPLESNAPGMLGGQLVRRLRTLGLPDATISAEALRKAWVAEHLGSNVTLNTLRTMMRVRSLRTIETLVRLHSPALPTDPAHLAYELGGLTSRSERAHRADW